MLGDEERPQGSSIVLRQVSLIVKIYGKMKEYEKNILHLFPASDSEFSVSGEVFRTLFILYGKWYLFLIPREISTYADV